MWQILITLSLFAAEKVDEQNYRRLLGFSHEQDLRHKQERERVGGLDSHLKQKMEHELQEEMSRAEYTQSQRKHFAKDSARGADSAAAVAEREVVEDLRLQKEKLQLEEAHRERYLSNRSKESQSYKERPLTEEVELGLARSSDRVPHRKRELYGAKVKSYLPSTPVAGASGGDFSRPNAGPTIQAPMPPPPPPEFSEPVPPTYQPPPYDRYEGEDGAPFRFYDEEY